MNNGETQTRNYKRIIGWGLVLLIVVGFWAVRQPSVRDLWLGMGYQADEKVKRIEDDLELTTSAQRIFAATRPSLEGKEEFNTHCENRGGEVSLLGCYTGGRIYVYEITDEQLATANEVTMAHELLHAVWERLGDGEREMLSELLEKLYEDKRDWFDDELTAYSEAEKIEEIYARAGTKLKELPEGLEKHYTKFFQNRGKIVQAYEDYETPFLALKVELTELAATIERVNGEIENERAVYLADVERLDAEIGQFNDCADTAGCFASQSEFEGRRAVLAGRKDALEDVREGLNQKITANNERIDNYRERQMVLGELNDAMDSRLSEIEEL